MAAKTYHGSCDCGKVRFETVFDIQKGTFKCNCRLCWKQRFWGAMVPADSFKILSGEGDLSKYGARRVHHFCRHCGIKIFGRGTDAQRVAINLAALDNLPPEDLAEAPVALVDGLHDNFNQTPSFSGHL